MSSVETGQMSQQQSSVLSQQQTSVLSQQKTSVLFQQNRSVLFQQNTSSLLEEQKSVLSQQFRLWTPQIRGRAQNHQNGSKWVQNGRQASRIGPNESNHGSEAFPTGPGAKNLSKKGRNLEIGRSGPPLSGSTAQDLPPNVYWTPSQSSESFRTSGLRVSWVRHCWFRTSSMSCLVQL